MVTLFVLFKKRTLMDKKPEIYIFPEGYPVQGLAGKVPLFLTKEDAEKYLEDLGEEWDAMRMDPGMRNDAQPRKIDPVVVGFVPALYGEKVFSFIGASWEW